MALVKYVWTVGLLLVAADMSWLDHLPSSERAKIRKKMRSPAAYEKLREVVKGPEDLAEEMEKNESVAELQFALETEPRVQEKLQQYIGQAIKETGIENVVETANASRASLQSISAGNFTVAIESSPSTEAMVLQPEGNVAEKIPVKTAFSDRYI